jgi:hypothetical protein
MSTESKLPLFIGHVTNPVDSKASDTPGMLETVDGLYCKRPIQWLVSSEILTPHLARRVCPAFGAGGCHTR